MRRGGCGRTLSDGMRQRAREERSRRGVAAAVRVAREHGLTVQVLHGDAHPETSMMDAEAIGARYRPDPEILARCKELRTLQVVLALVAFREKFGDLDGWEESIRSMLGGLA